MGPQKKRTDYATARLTPLFVVFCLLANPTAAYANAGTPLMWASMLHLVFGNALIGLLEGLLLSKLFGGSKGKSVGLLILANYFSAWIGGLWLRHAILGVLPLNLNNAWVIFWAMVVLTYVFTLALELPFVALAVRRDSKWLRNCIRGSLVIQTTSYALLFGWYWMASGTSLYTKTEVVKPSELSLPEEVLVYFISTDDGDVHVTSLATLETKKDCDLKSKKLNDRLFVQHSSSAPDKWNLFALLNSRENEQVITLKEGFASEAAPSWRSTMDPPHEEDSWFNFGEAARLGTAKDSAWQFRSGFWPVEGLRGTNSRTGAKAGFSYETPFGAWNVRNVTLLPTDKVLFQLGTDQICVFDPEKKRVALLARGRGPIAVLRDGPSTLPGE